MAGSYSFYWGYGRGSPGGTAGAVLSADGSWGRRAAPDGNGCRTGSVEPQRDGRERERRRLDRARARGVGEQQRRVRAPRRGAAFRVGGRGEPPHVVRPQRAEPRAPRARAIRATQRRTHGVRARVDGSRAGAGRAGGLALLRGLSAQAGAAAERATAS